MIQKSYQSKVQNPQVIQKSYQSKVQNPQVIQKSYQSKVQKQEVESDGEQLGQERSPPDLDELFAEEEDVTEGAVKPEEQGELDRLNREYNELVGEVGDVLNYQVLRFAVPMTSRRSAEVNSKMRELYLQIRAEGLEVVRCHSDPGNRTLQQPLARLVL